MRTKQQHWISSFVVFGVVLSILFAAPAVATAQDQEKGSFLGGVVKGVVFDPTTYVPAALGYDSTVRDWNTSQTFFQHGFYERNPRFTISGRANDLPVTYGEGNKRILIDALGNLQVSLVNNFTSRIIERSFLDKYPEHSKLIKTLGWIERSAFAAYMGYVLSEAHYRQWQYNQNMAVQLGY